jgi:tetratricopeptide (TPR) repeat protein
MLFKEAEQLAECGLVSPEEFEREMDMGNYIGFANGVYDILNDRFMPKGRVPLNVLASMCTNYDYVGTDDPRVAFEGADVAFLPREGPPRTVRLRYSSIEAKAAAPEVRLRSLIDDAARWYAERFAANSSSFRELHLDAGPGLQEGVDLLLAADFAGAEKAFRAETVRAPDRSAAWYDLGVSLELLGKWKSALDAYERALQLDARAIEAEKAVAALKRMLAN